MRTDWELVKLGSVCDVQNGFAFDSKLFNNEGKGLPLIRIRDIKRGFSETFTTEKCDEAYIVKDGEYLIGMDGEFNIGQWKSENALLNQRVCKLLPSSKVLPRLVYYYIPKALKDIEAKTAYATVKHLSSKQIKEISIPNLPIHEQQRIVDILDQEFAKIDALKANAEKSLQAAKDLFQATLKKELEPKEGWKTMTMGEVSLIARGGSPRPIKAFITEDEDGINWIKIGDTEVGGKFIYKTKEKIRREGMRSSRYVEAGDFLLSNSMSFGRPYILKTDGCIHDGWLVIKKYEETFTQDFLYYLLLSPRITRQFEEGARGSTVRNLNTDIVSAVKVSFPTTKDEQESIVRRVEDQNFKCKSLQENYQKTLALCDDLKQSLLRKAFNGEL